MHFVESAGQQDDIPHRHIRNFVAEDVWGVRHRDAEALCGLFIDGIGADPPLRNDLELLRLLHHLRGEEIVSRDDAVISIDDPE